MAENPGKSSAASGGHRCLDISLQALASHLQAAAGREIPFTRALLTIRNVCDEEVFSVVPHATLGQEGGTVQDVTASFAHLLPASIPPGEIVTWDVYDLLLPAHPGTASKIHMFGYRAALNWRFDLAAWAEYLISASAAPTQTPVSRWTLRWSLAETDKGKIELTIEDLNA